MDGMNAMLWWSQGTFSGYINNRLNKFHVKALTGNKGDFLNDQGLIHQDIIISNIYAPNKRTSK